MLEVKNLCKVYDTFSLKNVSFTLEKGYIMGFIGANGAGKSTTLKAILNFVKKDGGSVNVFGMDFDENELEIKEQIGFMLSPVKYYNKSKIKKVADVYKRFFKSWDEQKYQKYLQIFKLDENKKICELSMGMSVKLGIAFALSHGAKLIIFDEPTSGLDPIARDELLDIFQDIVKSGERSVLFSTHITSDLDKCADFILFIRDGEIALNGEKDAVIEEHKIVSGALCDLEEIKDKMVSFKENAYGFKGLIKCENMIDDTKYIYETPNLEDLMIYYNKEGKEDEKFTL